MTKQKQSELPFKINYELLHSTTSVYIWNDNKQIAIVHGNNYAEAQANAEFIVKACNNHYQLLEALKEAREQLEVVRHWGKNGVNGKKEPFLARCTDEVISKAKQAISKAESEG